MTRSVDKQEVLVGLLIKFGLLNKLFDISPQDHPEKTCALLRKKMILTTTSEQRAEPSAAKQSLNYQVVKTSKAGMFRVVHLADDIVPKADKTTDNSPSIFKQSG